MSGEKGANLAPKEVCMGEPGEIGACGEGGKGASQSEGKVRLQSSDDPSVTEFRRGRCS